jgi:hypothetical protein
MNVVFSAVRFRVGAHVLRDYLKQSNICEKPPFNWGYVQLLMFFDNLRKLHLAPMKKGFQVKVVNVVFCHRLLSAR